MAFEKYKITNNAFGTLIAGISASATSAQLQSGEGSSFPTGGDFIGTIVQYSTPADPTSDIIKQESVLVTNRASDVLTITRGFGGDTPTAFDAGDWLYLNVRAEHIQDIYDEVDKVRTDFEAADTALDSAKLNKGELRTALASAWRIFYSNGSNNEIALALGTSGTYLKSNGASSTPTWSNPPLDINGQTPATTIDDADTLGFYDDSEGGNKKITSDNLSEDFKGKTIVSNGTRGSVSISVSSGGEDSSSSSILITKSCIALYIQSGTLNSSTNYIYLEVSDDDSIWTQLYTDTYTGGNGNNISKTEVLFLEKDKYYRTRIDKNYSGGGSATARLRYTQ